ncbi:HlyD family secretion protein [Sulfurimonas sp.]|nr:HlyD family secretion protein [Sulfurimonas sp.]
MKILIAMFLLFSALYSKVYYSKIEPYELRDISSNISGLVLFVNEDMLGAKLSSEPYIKIDAILDEKELVFVSDKLEYMRESVKVNEAILVNVEKSLNKKRDNYKKVEALKFKSSVEKDREFYDLVSSENLYLNTKKEIQNLKIQITDMKLRYEHLKRSIEDKNLNAKGFILYELFVKPGQVVGISTPLAKVADVSRAKLTLFLDEDDMLNADKKVVYIEGEKTDYKLSRVSNIAHSKNISKYMAQVLIESPKVFSKLVKVELRDE